MNSNPHMEMNNKARRAKETWKILRSQGLDRYFTLVEKVLLCQPWGTWNNEALDRGRDWLGELRTLQWALRETDFLPSSYEPADIRQVVIAAHTRSVCLQAEKEIYREWMLMTHYLVRAMLTFPPEGCLIWLKDDITVERICKNLLAEGLIPHLIDGDLSVDGTSFQHLPQVEVIRLFRIWNPRVKALRWLLGIDTPECYWWAAEIYVQSQLIS